MNAHAPFRPDRSQFPALFLRKPAQSDHCWPRQCMNPAWNRRGNPRLASRSDINRRIFSLRERTEADQDEGKNKPFERHYPMIGSRLVRL